MTLPATCPEDPAQRRFCGNCLRQRLVGRPGIRRVQLVSAPEGGCATVELDYDPRLLSLSQLEHELREAGVCLTSQRAQVLLGIDGMVSPRTEQAIEAALARLPGVVASASFASRSLRVEFDRGQCALPEIVRRLDQLGLRVREGGPPPAPLAPPRAAPSTQILTALRQYHKLAMALFGGLFLLAAFLVHWLDGPPLLRAGLLVPAYVLAGWYTFIATLHTLRRIQFDIDVFMFAAAFGAAFLGHHEEGALLLFLFAMGTAGEELAMDRARNAIHALANLAPETATVRDEAGGERLVRVEDLAIGDRVVVRPFDRVPVDGVVVSGVSAVDQAPITGESVPVEKAVGSAVFAGTINGEGLLHVRVTRPAGQSTLARIVRMVREAQTTKSPTQVFTDRVERWYVPFVLIATVALMVVPPLLGVTPRTNPLHPWKGWLYQAMAFLTAASPCALAIGTPAAVLSGIARAARIGVLVKGGVHLENLGRVRAVAFDKTGTLTRGRPQLVDIVALDTLDADGVLALAAAVERGSTHPLARAIVAEAEARGCVIDQSEQVEQLAGKGVMATVGGRRIAVGHVGMLDADERRRAAPAIERLAADGRTTVVVAVDSRVAGVLALADRPRDNAVASLQRLKEHGIQRTVMLTGDNEHVAGAMAAELGVDEYVAGLLPEDKVAALQALMRRFGQVAMVGDGVNDAPAMASATVGIAMGGAGSDVAIETADVALMADDLAKLPDAIGLSRFSRRIIAQNLAIALGVIALLAPAAALGFAYLGVAVLFHEGSTVLVVLNSLRLLIYRARR